MSEIPGLGQQNPPSPDDPLERLYYLHDGMGVIGPIKGLKLKEMIESGAVGRGSNLNLVGAPNWTPIMEFAPFPRFFKSGEAGPDYGAPGPAAAPGPGNFASFWIRLGAHIIDNVLTLLLLTVAALIFSIVIVAIHGDGAEDWARANANIIGVIEFIPIIAYYAYFSAGPWQATPGKRICGIYVIRTNGARLDATVRGAALFNLFSLGPAAGSGLSDAALDQGTQSLARHRLRNPRRLRQAVANEPDSRSAHHSR